MTQFNLALVAYITKLKNDQNNNLPLRECDYSKMISLLLPQFFNLNNNWCIVPEFTLPGGFSPDYLVSLVNTTAGFYYGYSNNRLVVETKNRVAVSWWMLLRDQLYDQCDNASSNGKVWAGGLIGFEICFFLFDTNRFPSRSQDYRGFGVLNLRNYTTDDLDYLNIKYITELDNNGNEEIRVIKWRLDDHTQHIYILEMIQYISQHDA